MASEVSLQRMVDLAIGTPNTGAINFSVLKALLIALIQKLELSDTTVPCLEIHQISKSPQLYFHDAVSKVVVQDQKGDSGPKESDAMVISEGVQQAPQGDGAFNVIINESETDADSSFKFGEDSKSSTQLSGDPNLKDKQSLESLEKKVSQLEITLNQMSVQDSSNKQLFDQVKTRRRSSAHLPEETGDLRRPVSEMWQKMQLTNRVAANEEGIGKVNVLQSKISSQR